MIHMRLVNCEMGELSSMVNLGLAKMGRYYDQYNTDNDGMNHSPIDSEPNLSFDNLSDVMEISNFEQK